MTAKHVGRMSLVLWTGMVMGMTNLGCMPGFYGYPPYPGYPGDRMTTAYNGPGPRQPGRPYQDPHIVQAQYQPHGQAIAAPQAAGPGPDGHVYPPDQIQGYPPGAEGPGEHGPLPGSPGGPPLPMPTELAKTYHPPYIIEPPDVLRIDAVRLVPRPPYRISPFDVLLVQVTETLPNQPINGNFIVAPEGTISLGFGYGTVRISGLTLEQAAVAIRNHLRLTLKDPQVSVSLLQFAGVEQTRGDHLVAMDGSITLGSYGSVCVAGLTVCQAKAAIEHHLSHYLLNPEISLTVSAYNSKVFYVITDGAGYGEQVYRFAITGNETVLDAISYISGLPAQASTKKIWLARPTPAHAGCYQILPVNWQVIAQAGDTDTNYQLFPGDRIYVKADPLIALDNNLAKLFAPIQRIMGLILLTNTTIQSFRNNRGNGNNTGGAGFGFGF